MLLDLALRLSTRRAHAPNDDLAELLKGRLDALLRALVLRSGLAEYFVCTERTPTQATFATKRKGDPNEVSLRYTIAEAKTAWSKGEEAWSKSGWTRNPADMCVARASSKLARLVYADILEGLYSTEEFD